MQVVVELNHLLPARRGQGVQDLGVPAQTGHDLGMFAPLLEPALIRRYSDEHFALLTAIASRDPEGADAAMRRHMLSLTLTIGPVVTNRI